MLSVYNIFPGIVKNHFVFGLPLNNLSWKQTKKDKWHQLFITKWIPSFFLPISKGTNDVYLIENDLVTIAIYLVPEWMIFSEKTTGLVSNTNLPGRRKLSTQKHIKLVILTDQSHFVFANKYSPFLISEKCVYIGIVLRVLFNSRKPVICCYFSEKNVINVIQ